MAAYLARRLDRAGIRYEKRDNCFLRIDFHTFVYTELFRRRHLVKLVNLAGSLMADYVQETPDVPDHLFLARGLERGGVAGQ